MTAAELTDKILARRARSGARLAKIEARMGPMAEAAAASPLIVAPRLTTPLDLLGQQMNRQYASVADREEGKTTFFPLCDYRRGYTTAVGCPGFVRRAGRACAVKDQW